MLFKKYEKVIKTNEEYADVKRHCEKVENYLKHHTQPVTRRQFLSSGIVRGTATMMLPTVFEMLARSGVARAQEACASTTTMPAFVAINLSGGASLAGNFIPKGKNGEDLPTYGPLGMGSPGALTRVTPFGETGPQFASFSGVATGITATASLAALANTACVGVCVSSQDDTSNNRFDPSSLIVRAKQGLFLPVLGRNRNMPALFAKPPSLNVSNLNDIAAAIGVQGSISQMNENQKGRLFTMLQRLSDSQARKLASTQVGAGLGKLVREASETNSNLIGNTSSRVDPTQNTDFTNIWNFNNNREARDGAVVYNALIGNASMCSLEMGGYDYHGNGRANQDTDDTAAGVKIGQVIESLHALQKPGMVIVTSDGAIGHTNSSAAQTAPMSDRGQHGMAYMFFYHPNGRPPMSSNQLGWFKSSGNRVGADESFVTGGSAELATAAMVANYLAFAGNRGQIDSVLPRVFSTEQMNQVIVVAG